MVQERELGKDAYCSERGSKETARARTYPQCRHSRQSNGQDESKRGARGYDGGKKINGRKRQVLVDTLGLILHLKVHTADVQDRAAVAFLQGVQARYPRLEHVWVDQGYTGSGKTWIEEHLGWSVTVVQHPPRSRGEWVPIGDINDLAHLRFEWRRLPPLHTGFRGVLPRRWVVERTFAWLTFCRRLCKDYEFLPESSESWIYASQIRLLLRRLVQVLQSSCVRGITLLK